MLLSEIELPRYPCPSSKKGVKPGMWTFLGAYDVSKRSRSSRWKYFDYRTEILDIWKYIPNISVDGIYQMYIGVFSDYGAPCVYVVYKMDNLAGATTKYLWQTELCGGRNITRERFPDHPFYDVLNQIAVEHIAVEHLAGELDCVCPSINIFNLGCQCGGK